ncbi:MAG: ADP-ribose pyrophosphatase [Parcubacteria group bacterium]|nr:ADP-ribose pyrophosphatase [Parcubacteria group bacterium]
MNQLLVLKGDQSQEYPIRLVAKVVILDKENNILLFNNYLPGGGVESGETMEEGLKRECLEEVGAVVTIEKELGVVIQYRDFIQKKYEIHGFLTRLISLQNPISTQKDEIGKNRHFMKISEAKKMLEDRIKEMESSELSKDSEEYQSRYYHRLTSLKLIEEAQKGLV